MNGVPELAFLNTSKNIVNGTAKYVKGSGSNILTFEYIVQSLDNAMDIDVVSLDLKTATIKDGVGNSAIIAIPTGSLSANKDLSIDNIAHVIVDFDNFRP